MKTNNKIKGVSTGSWLTLIVIVLILIGPVFIIILSSFKLDKDIFTYIPKIIFNPTLKNYQILINKWPEFFSTIRNSIIVSFFSCFLVVLTSLPAAYSYSRMAKNGLSYTSIFLIAVRMFPPIIITIPLYPLLSRMHLLDTPIVLIMLYTVFQVSLITMLLKTFIDTIPYELDEQAQIDGASRTYSFIKITLPLTMPGIVTSTVLVFITTWNEFDFAYLMTGTASKTAPVMIAEMLSVVGQGGFISWGIIFAAATVQVIPVMVTVWFIQNWLISGLKIGAIKG